MSVPRERLPIVQIRNHANVVVSFRERLPFIQITKPRRRRCFPCRFVRERHPFILIENHAHVVVSRKRLPLIKKSHQRRFVRERLPFVQKPRQRWFSLVDAFHCSNLNARRRGVSREHLSFAHKTTTETIKGRHKDSKRPIIKRSHQRHNKGHHKKNGQRHHTNHQSRSRQPS